MKTKLCLTAITTLFIAISAFGQYTAKQIDSLMEKSMKALHVAGASIAVVKDGKIILKKGYGVKSITTKAPVNEFTNFQIASNSKAFTAAALSILVDEGKISWTDKVNQYIPEFKMYNDYVTQNFIIEDLLCHRSGLGLGAGDLMIFPDGTDFTINDVLTNFQHFKPVSPFRTKWDYDNQLYSVAGELIKRVSGITWEEFVRTRIFEPLQMKNSYPINSYIKDFSNVATPHNAKGEKINTTDFYDFGTKMNGAAGGIFSNVDDMSKWLQLQLNGGKYGEKLDKTLFSAKRQKEMWSIHTMQNANYEERYKTHFSGYGLGWSLKDIKGNLVVQHTGGLNGMLSIVRMIPEQNLGIVILTNTDRGGIYLCYAVAESITDNCLGLSPKDWIKQYTEFAKGRDEEAEKVVSKVWKTVEENKHINVKDEDYIGVYEDKWFGKVEIFMKDKQLWFKSYRSPKLNGAMYFYKANTFAVKWGFQDMEPDAFAMFGLDEEGKAQTIKMKGISPNIDFSYDFQDLNLQRVK